MYRHELRFVPRFGSANSSTSSHSVSTRRRRPWLGAAADLARDQRHVNQFVVEHDFTSLDAFRNERAAFHDDPGGVGEVLARLSELAVPGTAVEFEFDGVESASPAE